MRFFLQKTLHFVENYVILNLYHRLRQLLFPGVGRKKKPFWGVPNEKIEALVVFIRYDGYLNGARFAYVRVLYPRRCRSVGESSRRGDGIIGQ